MALEGPDAARAGFSGVEARRCDGKRQRMLRVKIEASRI